MNDDIIKGQCSLKELLLMTLENRPFFENVLKEDMKMLQRIEEVIKNENDQHMKTCWDCNREMKLIRRSEKIYYTVDGEQREIKIHNLPYYECADCENVVGDLNLYADLEDAIDKETFYKLNKREEIPLEVDFLQLV